MKTCAGRVRQLPQRPRKEQHGSRGQVSAGAPDAVGRHQVRTCLAPPFWHVLYQSFFHNLPFDPSSKRRYFTKTGSGETQGTHSKKKRPWRVSGSAPLTNSYAEHAVEDSGACRALCSSIDASPSQLDLWGSSDAQNCKLKRDATTGDVQVTFLFS